jgi:hypothetical protein
MDEKLQACHASRVIDSFRREMEFRTGAENAITIDALGRQLDHTSRRETEQFLELHIGDLPFCVVSGATGYFRPQSADDINHYCNSLRSRIKCLAIRHRTVIRAARKEGFQREGKRFVNAPTQAELFKEVI